MSCALLLPFQAAIVDTPGYSLDVALDLGDRVLADESGGLRIIDVSTPAAPDEVGSVTGGFYSFNVAVEWPFAYFSSIGEVVVADVSSPSSPVVTGSAAGFATGMCAASTYVYATGGNVGLRIYRGCLAFSDGFESGDARRGRRRYPDAGLSDDGSGRTLEELRKRGTAWRKAEFVVWGPRCWRWR